MNFKKNWKRFWTLSSAREGFTLVELIVVIAILAILAGVAVPAYSGYVTKANMQADMTLASEVAHALTLYYYANPGTTGGYVVLNQEGTDSTADAVGAAAMEAVFGAGWEKTAALKYNSWGSDGLLNLVAGYDEDTAKTIANSTFLTEATPEGIMNTVTNLTGLISDRIVTSDLSQAATRLTTLLGPDSSVVTTLNSLGMDSSDPDYATVVSNLLVGHFSNELSSESGELSPLANLAITYGTLYAYSEATGDTTLIDALNKNLDNISYNQLSGDDCYDNCMAGLYEMESWSDYADYATEYGETDSNAFLEMMGAVSLVAGSYTDKDSLSDSNLYASDSVAQQVNSYVNAVKAVASGLAIPSSVSPGSVVVILGPDGTTTVDMAT